MIKKELNSSRKTLLNSLSTRSKKSLLQNAQTPCQSTRERLSKPRCVLCQSEKAVYTTKEEGGGGNWQKITTWI